MPGFSNTAYFYNNLPGRFGRSDAARDFFLKRFLTPVGDEMDGFDNLLDTFFQKIAPETASEEFINWWLWSLFGWGWFPGWFTLAKKRAFYADLTEHYARRGTKQGIEKFLLAFGVRARVIDSPQVCGEMTLDDDPTIIYGPLGVVVQIFPQIDSLLVDEPELGEWTFGEDHLIEPGQNIQTADIEALLRFQTPLGQVVMIEFLPFGSHVTGVIPPGSTLPGEGLPGDVVPGE